MSAHSDGAGLGRWARNIVFLVPYAAGAGIGALVNRAIDVPEIAGRFWPGAQIDIATAPDPAMVNFTCIAATLAVWLVFGWLTRNRGPLTDALRHEAYAFLPALSILAMSALDDYGIVPDILMFAVHAAVLSAAGFLAINVFYLASRPKPPLARATAFVDARAGAIVAVAAALYWAAFSAMGTLQYYSMRISYTDTADWEQMLWNTLHGRFLMSSAFPHMFFGEHVQVIHLLLLPLYALFPSLITLMIVKSAVLASGAFPVYLLAVRRIGSRAAAACFALAYLLYPAMQFTDLELAPNTFRPETFAIPALLWAVYFLDTERMGGLVAAALFALASKEEMALPVAMIGALLLLRRKWAWGTAFFLVGAGWFLAAVLWIIPHFRGEPTHMTKYFLDFGQNPTVTSIARHIIKHPLHALGVAVRPMKIDYLLMLLVPLGLRPLFSWRMLLVMLPSLAAALLESYEPSFRIWYHYQISLVAFLVMGAVYGAANCAGLVGRLGLIGRGLDEGARKKAATAALTMLVLASSLVGNMLYAKSPLSLLFYNPHMDTYWRAQYVPSERARVFFREVRPLVPEGAPVSATEFAATYFAARQDDFVFPTGTGQADYLVVDTKEKWLGDHLAQKGMTLQQALDAPGYERIFEKDGFVVYRNSAAAGAR